MLGRSDLRRMAGVAAVYRLLRAAFPRGCARAIGDHLAQRVYGWLASASWAHTSASIARSEKGVRQRWRRMRFIVVNTLRLFRARGLT